MQLLFARKLIGMYVRPILRKTFPNETGAARLQQIGLFTLIFMLEEGGTPVTARRLSEITGQHVSGIHKQLEKLLDVKVVGKRRALNQSGRGHVLHFFVKQNAKTKQLLKALDKAAKKKR